MSAELGYTIEGRGGLALFWLDDSGNIPWSALDSYNFALLPGGNNWAPATYGSFQLSTPFAVAAGQQLTVMATLMTAHSDPWFDVGFALLVQGTQVQAILFANRPDAVAYIGDLGPNPGTILAAPSAGVTVTANKTGPANVQLGGITYGPPQNAGDGNVSTSVTAVCSPPAGQYQLLFGMFSVTNGPANPAKPAAMMVQFVDVRQPQT